MRVCHHDWVAGSRRLTVLGAPAVSSSAHYFCAPSTLGQSGDCAGLAPLAADRRLAFFHIPGLVTRLQPESASLPK